MDNEFGEYIKKKREKERRGMQGEDEIKMYAEASARGYKIHLEAFMAEGFTREEALKLIEITVMGNVAR